MDAARADSLRRSRLGDVRATCSGPRGAGPGSDTRRLRPATRQLGERVALPRRPTASAGLRTWSAPTRISSPGCAPSGRICCGSTRGERCDRRRLRRAREIVPDLRIVCYSPDDMINPDNQSAQYLAGIPSYDLHVTTKSYNVEELRALGARDVHFVDNAYDPATHRPFELTDEERRELACRRRLHRKLRGASARRRCAGWPRGDSRHDLGRWDGPRRTAAGRT